jgi:predicted Rossmann fold flavoprotein
MPKVRLTVAGSDLETTGPLLITHHGLSGPAVLKLSAWGARKFHAAGYHVEITVDWIGLKPAAVEQVLRDIKEKSAKKLIVSVVSFGFPKRLWERLVVSAGVSETQTWADLSRVQMTAIIDALTQGRFMVRGNSPFKEEFVTCGGVNLDEVNFKTMESRKSPGLYFAGEVLDIDGLTGGFNFQNAWTTGWLAGRAMAL